jgi:hypothetical protein
VDELHPSSFEMLLAREAQRPLPDVAADVLVAGYDSLALCGYVSDAASDSPHFGHVPVSFIARSSRGVPGWR